MFILHLDPEWNSSACTALLEHYQVPSWSDGPPPRFLALCQPSVKQSPHFMAPSGSLLSTRLTMPPPSLFEVPLPFLGATTLPTRYHTGFATSMAGGSWLKGRRSELGQKLLGQGSTGRQERVQRQEQQNSVTPGHEQEKWTEATEGTQTSSSGGSFTGLMIRKRGSQFRKHGLRSSTTQRERGTKKPGMWTWRSAKRPGQRQDL